MGKVNTHTEDRQHIHVHKTNTHQPHHNPLSPSVKTHPKKPEPHDATQS